MDQKPLSKMHLIIVAIVTAVLLLSVGVAVVQDLTDDDDSIFANSSRTTRDNSFELSSNYQSNSFNNTASSSNDTVSSITRDVQRGRDMSRLITELLNYQSNNNGSYPESTLDMVEFESEYLLAADLKDPSTGFGYTYLLDLSGDTLLVLPRQGTVIVAPGNVCPDSLSTATARSIAVATASDDGRELMCRDFA